MTDRDELAAHVGWLIWCMSEGYVTAEDRAILSNWLLDDDATLTPDDQADKAALLVMADEVLADMERAR